MILKDEDFGEPHIRKKIHKVYVTAKNGDNITLSAAVNGSENFSDITFNSASLTTSNSWYKTEHKVTNGGNNVESIQIKDDQGNKLEPVEEITMHLARTL